MCSDYHIEFEFFWGSTVHSLNLINCAIASGWRSWKQNCNWLLICQFFGSSYSGCYMQKPWKP